MTIREFTDEEIDAQVRGLESLQSGSLAAAALLGCGQRTIPPLRSFLLNGLPRGIYQPRQLAVETLAQLGAKDVLIEYLRDPAHLPDAVVRMGEDAVRSTAARQLARWQTEDVFRCLTNIAMDHLLPGVVESLGKFRRPETMPYFLWALGDGVCRPYAEEAIRNLGEMARPGLVEAATAPDPSCEEETPSSLQRRRWALRILADLELREDEWERLSHSLNESDPDIVITVARIALQDAPAPERRNAVRRMMEMLPAANWFLRTEARTALAEHFDLTRQPIEEEIAQRTKVDRRQQALDTVLRLLVNLREQALEAAHACQQR
ncbi:MAG: hypothetical protein ACRD5K_08300 [Candidatus Acidiferrales bacterium]